MLWAQHSLGYRNLVGADILGIRAPATPATVSPWAAGVRTTRSGGSSRKKRLKTHALVRSFRNRKEYLHDLGALVLDTVALWRGRAADRGKRSNGLLLIQLDSVGDFICWLPLAKALSTQFRDQEITLVAHERWADWAARFPYWHHVIPTSYPSLRGSYAHRFDVMRRIACIRPATTINVARFIPVQDCIVRVSGAPEKIGPSGSERPFGREPAHRLTDRWYSQIIATPERHHGSVHEIHRAFHRALGCQAPFALPELPDAVFEPFDLQIGEKPFFLVAPFSQSHLRDWGADRFARVSRELAGHRGLVPVFTGTREHAPAIQRAISDAGISDAVNVAGATSLAQLATLTRGAALVLTNESGPVHLAYATRTPSVCILGGGHFGQLLPYPAQLLRDQEYMHRVLWHELPCFHCNWKCVYVTGEGTAPCVSSVTEDDVIAACLAVVQA